MVCDAGKPAVLLTVSGPGAVHGLAGCSHATTNAWPLIMLSGSAETVSPRSQAFRVHDVGVYNICI